MKGKLVQYRLRKRLLVDKKVQGALLARAAVYWFLFAVTLFEVALSWEIATGPNGPFLSHFRFFEVLHEHWTVLLAGVCLLPVLMLDVAMVSSRIVGPLNRVRDTLRRLAAGDRVTPIEFRERDYFWQMASEVNAVSARMAELEAKLRAFEDSEADTREIPEGMKGPIVNRLGR